jgi:hypothetical protein
LSEAERIAVDRRWREPQAASLSIDHEPQNAGKKCRHG